MGYCLVLMLAAASISPARVHSIYGSLLGTVTDQSGAVVPGVSVSAIDPGGYFRLVYRVLLSLRVEF